MAQPRPHSGCLLPLPEGPVVPSPNSKGQNPPVDLGRCGPNTTLFFHSLLPADTAAAILASVLLWECSRILSFPGLLKSTKPQGLALFFRWCLMSTNTEACPSLPVCQTAQPAQSTRPAILLVHLPCFSLSLSPYGESYACVLPRPTLQGNMGLVLFAATCQPLSQNLTHGTVHNC